MSTIDSKTAAAQQALFDKLGIKTKEDETQVRKNNDELGQQEFLKLMTTQLQNQDPFAPMENGDFIAQMAQFSTVTGINQINDGLSTLGDQLKKMRIATASNLLGHSVLVPGNLARADANGEVHGVLDLPEAASSVSISYHNAATGELLEQQELGPQTAGMTGFSWTNVPQAIVDANQAIKLEVTMNTGSGQQSMSPSVFAKVMSASASGAKTDDVMLDVQDYGEIAATNISKFR